MATEVGYHDFVCPARSDWKKTVTKKVNGLAFNWTGYTALVLTVREYHGGPLVFQITATDSVSGIATFGGVSATPTNGELYLWVKNAATAGLDLPFAVYDVESTDSAGLIKREFEGIFAITPELNT
jgi:hypothetical protein